MSDHAVPYRAPQPFGMRPELYTPGALSLDEGLWIPQAPGVWFRPLLLDVTGGAYVNLLRVEAAGVLSRHRHSGPVHAFTLRGEWRYLEHAWSARAGDYVFEPPGETHTLVVEAGEPMVTLFHVSGGYTYVDPDGVATGYEDVFTKLARARDHVARVGGDPATLEALIR
jgi:2,4'-dihydroxyacetophenone dioxygenase